MKILTTVAVIGFLVIGVMFVAHGPFDKQSANISEAVPTLTPEPLCDNHDEAEDFEKPIPVVWIAIMDGCLASCEGASFTRVPGDEKYPRFAGYYASGSYADIGQSEDTLKIYGDWVGIGADHASTVFDNKCVPIININKVEVVKIELVN